MENKYK